MSRLPRRHQVPDVPPVPAEYGTRRRVLPALVLGLGCLAFLYQLVSTSALAVNFTTTDKQFKLYTNYLDGIVAAGVMSPSTKHSGVQLGVADIAVKEAHLAGLCMVSIDTIPGINVFGGLVITAGVPVKANFGGTGSWDPHDGAGNPISVEATGGLAGQSRSDAVKVTDLFIASEGLRGYGDRLSGLNLGQSADQVSSIGTAPFPTGDGQAAPRAGANGLSIQELNIGSFASDTYGVHLTGNQILLPDLRVSFHTGGADQSTCQSQATAQ